MQHYEKDSRYTFHGRADQIKEHRELVLESRGRDNNDRILVEHVIMLSTTVEALLVSLAKMLENSY